MARMDWKKQGENQTFLYPEATYEVKVIKMERVTARTGSPQVRWTAEILNNDVFGGKKIVEHNVLTDNALWRVAKFAAACGVDLNKLPAMDTDSIAFTNTLRRCLGCKMYWQVTQGTTPQGKQKNNVADYLPHPDNVQIEEIGLEDVPGFLKGN